MITLLILALSLICWGIALGAHALLQPKILRALTLSAPRRGTLRLLRLVMPFCALALCLQLEICCAVLSWFGCFSLAGIGASAALTLASLRQRREHPAGTLAV